MIAWEGQFRIYYNSVKDAPMVWNIDDGGQNNQICIVGWHNTGAPNSGNVDENAEYPYPKAFLAGYGKVSILDGYAKISPILPKV